LIPAGIAIGSRLAPDGQTVHASAALVGGRGVLIRGASGSGKSSLLLALLFGSGGKAALIADDRVLLSVEETKVFAAPPAETAGLIEVRGVGIIRQPYVARAEIALVADLLSPSECPRLPTETEALVSLCGVFLRRIFIPVGMADGAGRVFAGLSLLDL
jgi:HPr kinase/phosphorylase